MRHVKRRDKVERAEINARAFLGDFSVQVRWIRATGGTPPIWVIVLEDDRHVHFDPISGDVHAPERGCCQADWWSLGVR